MSDFIQIIAGLGNPGEKYERTLHNAGFWFVEALALKYGGVFRYEKKFDLGYCKINLKDDDIWLIKPQNYMNLSGKPIKSFIDYYRLEVSKLLVVHDEIDLPSDKTRLKAGGGHGGHNGIRDVIHHCGAEFFRLRLGVGHPGHKSKVIDYVLKSGSKEVENAINNNIDDAIKVIPLLIKEGFDAATKVLHTKE
ncbi:MAG: aminoacyl-tRNA hydrolase [Gammaproteobacteria bacterium]|nr:aminoacyl-tRNA hydrolase [Gammaproteobacteria bacterium]